MAPFSQIRIPYHDRLIGLIGDNDRMSRPIGAYDARGKEPLEGGPGSTRLAIEALERTAAALQRVALQHDDLTKADTLMEIGNALRGLTIAKDVFNRAIAQLSKDKPASARKFGTVVRQIERSETTLREIEQDLHGRTTQ